MNNWYGSFKVVNSAHPYFEQTVKIQEEFHTYKDGSPHYYVWVTPCETQQRISAELSDLKMVEYHSIFSSHIKCTNMHCLCNRD